MRTVLFLIALLVLGSTKTHAQETDSFATTTRVPDGVVVNVTQQMKKRLEAKMASDQRFKKQIVDRLEAAARSGSIRGPINMRAFFFLLPSALESQVVPVEEHGEPQQLDRMPSIATWVFPNCGPNESQTVHEYMDSSRTSKAITITNGVTNTRTTSATIRVSYGVKGAQLGGEFAAADQVQVQWSRAEATTTGTERSIRRTVPLKVPPFSALFLKQQTNDYTLRVPFEFTVVVDGKLRIAVLNPQNDIEFKMLSDIFSKADRSFTVAGFAEGTKSDTRLDANVVGPLAEEEREGCAARSEAAWLGELQPLAAPVEPGERARVRFMSANGAALTTSTLGLRSDVKWTAVAVPAAADSTCYWNGQSYSPGAYVCDAGGSKHVCKHDGTWSYTGSC